METNYSTIALPHDAPAASFALPYEPPRLLDAQWYFFARYASGELCPPPSPKECCGQIRELNVMYTLTRCHWREPGQACPAMYAPCPPTTCPAAGLALI